MVVHYRLNELGRRLPASAGLIRRAEFEPIAEATALLQSAEARAAEIRAEAEAAYEAEKRRGHAEGLEAARREAAVRLLGESRNLDAGLAGLEGKLAKLVAGCVRKLLDDFGDDAKVEAIVRFALKQMRREARAEVRVAPAQVAHFRARAEAIRAEYPDIELFDVLEDAALGPRQAVVETPVGRVEGDFDERLDDLERILRAAHAPAPADELDAAGAGT